MLEMIQQGEKLRSQEERYLHQCQERMKFIQLTNIY